MASPWGGGAGSGFDGDGPDFEATLTRDESLAEHLERQLALATTDLQERLVGTYLINAIDEAGYLTETVEEAAERIGAPVELVGRVLSLIQTFDPPGIGARSLAECLAIQLRERDRFDPAMAALVDNLELLARRDMAGLKRVCGVDDEDLREMIGEANVPSPHRAQSDIAI